MRPLEIQTQSNGSGLHQHYSHIQFTNTMELNITDFATSPLVKDYFDRTKLEKQCFTLEIQLSNILEKKEEGVELNALDLVQHFQFQRFFTWKQEITYELRLQLSGTWTGSEQTIQVDKDFYFDVEEGDTDGDWSQLEVDPYSLDDPSEGIEIDESEVSDKYISVRVWDLKIKDEFLDIHGNVKDEFKGGAA